MTYSLQMDLVIIAMEYAADAFFQMMLLKAARHRFPGAAWVPLWNIVTLLELAGIHGAWALVGAAIALLLLVPVLLLGGLVAPISILGAPVVIFVIVVLIAVPIMSLVTAVWCAMAIQKATGLTSALGILLSLLLTPVWYLWMSVRIARKGYQREKAFEVGADYPFWWFHKLSDPLNAFLPEFTYEDLPG